MGCSLYHFNSIGHGVHLLNYIVKPYYANSWDYGEYKGFWLDVFGVSLKLFPLVGAK